MGLNTQKLSIKYKKAADAIEALKEAYESMTDVSMLAQCAHKDPKKIYKTYRDSLIRRFKYSFDATWKYVCDYLESEGRVIEIKTPKETFRQSFAAKILSENETRLALQMVYHRNLTTHGYDENLIEKISSNLHDYIQLIDLILERTHLPL